jgi:16S rRNA processing protein RimM
MSKGRVLLGVVAAPHGVRGLVRIRSYTEDPMAIASYGPLSDEAGRKQYRVEALSAVKGAVLARIEGVADRTAAEALRGLRLYVERERLPATDEREWYEADIVGLAAVGRDGRDWGKVIAFHDFGAGLTIEVSGGSASKGSVVLPFTGEAVPEIDVEGGKIVVDPPAGLLADGETKEA